jgi:hypothetical protein
LIKRIHNAINCKTIFLEDSETGDNEQKERCGGEWKEVSQVRAPQGKTGSTS